MKEAKLKQVGGWHVIEVAERDAILHRLPFQSPHGFRGWRNFIIRDELVAKEGRRALEGPLPVFSESAMTDAEQAALCLYRAGSVALLLLTGAGHKALLKMALDEHGPVAELSLFEGMEQTAAVYLRCPLPASMERSTIVVQNLDEAEGTLGWQTKVLMALYNVAGVAAGVSTEVVTGQMTFLQSLSSELSRALRPGLPRHNFTFMGLSVIFVLSMSPDVTLEMVETEETIMLIPHAGDEELTARLSEVMHAMLARLGPVTRRQLGEGGNA